MPSIRPAGGWSINPAVESSMPNEPEAISRDPTGSNQQSPVYVYDPAVTYKYRQSFVNGLRTWEVVKLPT